MSARATWANSHQGQRVVGPATNDMRDADRPVMTIHRKRELRNDLMVCLCGVTQTQRSQEFVIFDPEHSEYQRTREGRLWEPCVDCDEAWMMINDDGCPND